MLIRYLEYKETKYIFAPQFKKPRQAFSSTKTIITKIYCGVEQLVARWAHNPKVIGSSPVPATTADSFIESAFFVEMDHLVYILYSEKSKRSYTGYTSNLIQRFRSHNIFGKDSTAKYRPWIVIHLEFFNTREQATKREKYFKAGRGSIKKNELIVEFLARWAHTLP